MLALSPRADEADEANGCSSRRPSGLMPCSAHSWAQNSLLTVSGGRKSVQRRGSAHETRREMRTTRGEDSLWLPA